MAKKRFAVLGKYNLHYFEGLLSSQTSVDLKEKHIGRWIAENPFSKGIGWEPYPLSLRVVNWIKWAWLNEDINVKDFDKSLASQINYLYKNLEYHLLGNHLLENAKALIFGGCYFQGKNAKKWLNKGLKILLKELKEQILDDGGHFELSPMYHILIFELVLDLLALAKILIHQKNFATVETN